MFCEICRKEFESRRQLKTHFTGAHINLGRPRGMYKNNKWNKVTDEMVMEAVKTSKSASEILRKLNVRLGGTSVGRLKERIERLFIDTSHILGKGWCKGLERPEALSADEILISGREHDRAHLKKAMFKKGVEYICSKCKIDSVWNNEKLTLQIDHIDGDVKNNTLNNLRFLCPNCHSQTENYGFKKCHKSTRTRYVRRRKY